MSDTVRKLVRRCLRGDEAAVVDLVETFGGAVFGLSYRMLRHRQDAEDVTQETFVRALRSLSSWDPKREFLPWLLAIAGNRCRTLLSLRKRHPIASTLVEESSDDHACDEAARNLAEEVNLALGKLRFEYREAFLLFHQQELSYAEIAQALGCPIGTVKTWVHRARRELIALLRSRGVLEESRYAVRRL